MEETLQMRNLFDSVGVFPTPQLPDEIPPEETSGLKQPEVGEGPKGLFFSSFLSKGSEDVRTRQLSWIFIADGWNRAGTRPSTRNETSYRMIAVINRMTTRQTPPFLFLKILARPHNF
jgi:hypothetical protein